MTLSLIPGAAHIDLGRTIVGLLLFLLFAVSANGALIAPFLSPDPELRVRFMIGATVLSAHPELGLSLTGAASLGLVFIGIHNAWDTIVYVASDVKKKG